MSFVTDAARKVVYARRKRNLVRLATEMGDPALRAKIDAHGLWFQNYDLHGTPTKVRSFVGEPLDYPRLAWERNYAPLLTDVKGKSILDIGCNAGYYSAQCKLNGAGKVLGVDVNQGRPENVIEQAKFAASELGLDIEYRVQDYQTLPDEQFDIVLFIGVMYHLDDPIFGLRKAASMARHQLIIETRCVPDKRPIMEYARKGFDNDLTSPWAPSPRLVDDMLMEEGFTRFIRPRSNRSTRYLASAYRV